MLACRHHLFSFVQGNNKILHLHVKLTVFFKENEKKVYKKEIPIDESKDNTFFERSIDSKLRKLVIIRLPLSFHLKITLRALHQPKILTALFSVHRYLTVFTTHGQI